MCGIGVILDPIGAARPDAAQRMVDALRHRGPDGDGVKRIGPVSLAHTRLAIIDVAGGDQPLVSEDGQPTLIANGEIYNHRALRASLEERGHRFATGSDCAAPPQPTSGDVIPSTRVRNRCRSIFMRHEAKRPRSGASTRLRARQGSVTRTAVVELDRSPSPS